MTNKNKLRTFFNADREDVEYIEKYKENKVFFDELLKGHKEDIEFALHHKICHYAHPLRREGFFNEALKIAHEIDLDLEKLKGQSKSFEMTNRSNTFLKGVCYSKLKEYRKSNIEFEKLLKKDPANDNFIDWYKSNKKYIITDLFEKTTAIGFGIYLLILFCDFIDWNIPNSSKIKGYALIVGAISLVLPYPLKKYVDKQKIELNEKTAP